MRQSLFTTQFLEFDRRFHSALWLRVGLTGWQDDRNFVELKKLNRRFQAVFRISQGPTAAQEELYGRYRASLAFEPALSLKDLLLGDAGATLFSTWEIELYDGERLIGGGVFDVGARAAAGITSYYDPGYRRHSLGKYLIYLKMEFCRDRRLAWFYPGYAVPGQPRFDYKWSMGAANLEYLGLEAGGWLPYDPGLPVPDPLETMTDRLSSLAEGWEGREPRPRLTRYLHLDINLNPQLKGMDLFDYPVFLDCFPGVAASPVLVVVYDPRDGLYSLLHCRSAYQFDQPGDDPSVFESDLLMVHRTLFSTPQPEEMTAALAGFSLAAPR